MGRKIVIIALFVLVVVVLLRWLWKLALLVLVVGLVYFGIKYFLAKRRGQDDWL